MKITKAINEHRLARAAYLSAEGQEADDLFPAESEALRAVLYYPCETLSDLNKKLDYMRHELPTNWFDHVLGCCGGGMDQFLESIACIEAPA